MIRALISLLPAILVFSSTVQGDHSGHYAYVRYQIKNSFKCVQFPKTAVCPKLNIKVLAISLDTLVKTVENFNALLRLTPQLGVNKSCIEVARNLTCLGLPRCVGDGEIRVHSEAALAECRRGRAMAECGNFSNSVFFDCEKKEKEFNESIKASQHSCNVTQDPSGFCPDVKYKRFVSSDFDYNSTFSQIKSGVEGIKGNASKECYQKVKDVACSSLGACSDDEKYFLALYNQKDCNNTMDCLPESVRGGMKERLCPDAPNANNPSVKKVPYPTGNMTVPHPTENMATSLKNNAFQLAFLVVFSLIGTFLF